MLLDGASIVNLYQHEMNCSEAPPLQARALPVLCLYPQNVPRLHIIPDSFHQSGCTRINPSASLMAATLISLLADTT